mmetsp:Transcript_20512/g.78609  ORF Transcript_20512/g.78609 Transcript_20512/m.78609 type:complete len:138 (-) Transcript_20512:57-470(-)
MTCWAPSLSWPSSRTSFWRTSRLCASAVTRFCLALATYWGIGSEGSRKWPLLAQVARRYLAIPPTLCAAESSFSKLTQLDTPHRQRISPDTLAWELFVAYNGGTPADWSRKRMLAGHREVTRKRAKTDGGTSKRRRL